MPVAIDISEAAEQLQALHYGGLQRPDRTHQSLAVVVPLDEGQREVARAYLDEGPPFDPHALGLAGHEVFLTDREVVFVFETEQGVGTFDRILAEPEFWEVVSAWEHSMSEEPRVGVPVYEWREAGVSDEPSGSRRTR